MFNDILSKQFWYMESNYLRKFLENVQSTDINGILSDKQVISAITLVEDDGKKNQESYDLKDGIATIKIQGPLVKRVPKIIAFFFGIKGMEQIGQEFQAALEDKDVSGIMLDMDSPGGSVDGTAQLADIIYAGRGQKPIVAFANGNMTSAAYWIGSGADQVILADQTTRTGSIGVVGVHQEYSEMAKKLGIGLHVFSAGKFKKSGNQFEKLSKEDIKYINGQFTYLHNLFIDGVSRNLGIPKNKLPKDAKEARIYLGQEGIDAGLAHEILNRDQAMAKLRAMIGTRTSTSHLKSKTSANAAMEGNKMKFKNYGLKHILTEIQATDDLDKLSELEECLISEAQRRKGNAKNWVEENEAESLKNNIVSLFSQRRRMILAVPKAAKIREEFELGRSIGRS